MQHWTLVRLELARTPDFPEGSARHTYLLRLPLGDDGLIDETAFSLQPALATVRRSWPGEDDQTGYLLRKGRGWAFSYALGEDDDESLYHLEAHPIRLGEYLTVTEPDGARLPFRVASLTGDGALAA
jgi:hypothetical protein